MSKKQIYVKHVENVTCGVLNKLSLLGLNLSRLFYYLKVTNFIVTYYGSFYSEVVVSTTENITLDKIIIRGLALRIKSWFQLPSDPLFYSTTDTWLQLNEKAKQTNVKLEYPQVLFKMTGVGIRNDGGYNPKSLMRHGPLGSLSSSNNYQRKLTPLPVNMTFECMFISDDIKQVRTYLNNWLYAVNLKTLNLNVNFDGSPFSIQVELDSDITVPDKEASVEQVNNYQVISNIIVHGYMTPDRPLTDFPRVYRITMVNIIPHVLYTMSSYNSPQALETALANGDAQAELLWNSSDTVYEKISITIDPSIVDPASIV